MLITCITPFPACTFTAIIPISEFPEPSVIFAILPPVPGKVIDKLSPCKLGASVVPFGVKSPDCILPDTTWCNKTCVKTVSSGTLANALNAAFVGANTVKAASVSDNIETKSVAGVKVVKALTNVENVGSAAVTATFNEIENADVAIVIGANPIENHPVAATYFKQFTKRGGKLIIMDPRGQALKRFASHMLQFRPGADVSMLNAIMHVIVEEDLYDQQYIEAYTENWEAEKAHLKDFPPEKMAEICGIDAETLRDVARTFAGAKAAMIFWGMGVSQHIHGTDNSRCLISLALMTPSPLASP